MFVSSVRLHPFLQFLIRLCNGLIMHRGQAPGTIIDIVNLLLDALCRALLSPPRVFEWSLHTKGGVCARTMAAAKQTSRHVTVHKGI